MQLTGQHLDQDSGTGTSGINLDFGEIIHTGGVNSSGTFEINLPNNTTDWRGLTGLTSSTGDGVTGGCLNQITYDSSMASLSVPRIGIYMVNVSMSVGWQNPNSGRVVAFSIFVNNTEVENIVARSNNASQPRSISISGIIEITTPNDLVTLRIRNEVLGNNTPVVFHALNLSMFLIKR